MRTTCHRRHSRPWAIHHVLSASTPFSSFFHDAPVPLFKNLKCKARFRFLTTSK
ncbi:hypothetical protein WG66_011398, partial [Moniliophthora roreri]